MIYRSSVSFSYVQSCIAISYAYDPSKYPYPFVYQESKTRLAIVILADSLFQCLDLQSNHPRPVSAESEITTKEPEARVSALAPQGPDFALLIKAPDILDLIRELVAEDTSGLSAHVFVAGSKDDFVGRQFGAVCKFQAVGLDLGDLLTLLDLNLAVDDQLTGANIDIVSTSTLEAGESLQSALLYQEMTGNRLMYNKDGRSLKV